MSQVLLDGMDEAPAWSALGPDGVTPSTAIQLTNDPTDSRYGADSTSGRLTASTGALNHRLQRTIPATNLSNLDEIRLWFKSNRRSDGSDSYPFYLQFRLASDAMKFDHPANQWARYFPVSQTRDWEMIRFTLGDLPAGVRTALTSMQLRITNAGASLACHLDTVLAVREQALADVEAALVARLDQKVSVNGTGVPALVFDPDDDAAPALPHIRITPADIQWAGERTMVAPARGDYTDHGFQLRPPPTGLTLLYDVDVYAAGRAIKSRIFEFILSALAPRTELIVNGAPLTLELIPTPPPTLLPLQRLDRTPIRFRVTTWQQSAPPQMVVRPYTDVLVLVGVDGEIA